MFEFAGYERDDISGLYYAQTRRYDAQTVRFTSRDMIKGKISHMQSQNEYAYCLGNPLIYVDRDGREPQFVSREDYKQIGYDENGIPIIRKEDEDVESLDYTGYVVDGVDLINETGNLIAPEVIKQQPKPPNIGKEVWNQKIATDIAKQQKIYSATKVVTKWIGPGIVAADTVKNVHDNVKKEKAQNEYYLMLILIYHFICYQHLLLWQLEHWWVQRLIQEQEQLWELLQD